MSRRRELEIHRRKLNEIRNIMNSMKVLANMETHKLARVVAAQEAIVHGIEGVAADFMRFFPQLDDEAKPTHEVILLLGSERGFCGNFNEALVQHLEYLVSDKKDGSLAVIAMGHKLRSLLEDYPITVQFMDGANVVEESEAVLRQLVDILTEQQLQHPDLFLTVLYHGGDEQEVISQRLLPPFSRLDRTCASFTQRPLLNITPSEFFIGLIEHYLLAVLHQLIYSSLAVENTLRMQHLDGAVQHLDDKSEELSRRGNALRQEEIIEEIEVILLNAVPVQGIGE